MRLDKIDLNLFVVFDTIYTERNLTRAAEVLSITQPAVSNSLNRLRKALNDQLFVRTPQAMMPTPVADNIIGQVREALTLLTASVQENDVFEPDKAERTFKFSMNDMAESLLLPPLLKQLHQQSPGIKIISYPHERREIATDLASGQLDFAIDIPVLSNSHLCHQRLTSIHSVCAVREGHPIGNKKLTLEDYLGLSHILVSSRRQGLGLVDIVLNRLGRKRDISLRISHHLVAQEIALNSDLALTLPRSLAERNGFTILELPFTLDPLNWHLYWHKSADNDPANLWVREQIRSALVNSMT